MKVFSHVVCCRFAASCLTLFAAVAIGLPSFAENATYTWTASGSGIGSSSYVKIFDDVGAFNGRLRLAGFSTADGEYTITSNRVHVLGTSSANGELPAGAFTYQMSCGARFDGAETKSIRVQLAQPANSNALYARITAIATADGDHMDVPDLRVAINDDHTVVGIASTDAAELLANAVTSIVVEVKPVEAIAYWPFGTNGFHDVSGNGHDLEGVEVAESDAAYISLNDGRTDQYLKTATALNLTNETAVTFECWCRITGHPTGTYNIAFASANPGAGTGGFVVYNSGIYQAQMRAATDGWQLDSTYTNDGVNVTQSLSPSTYVDGAWHHIAYVVDRSRTDHYSCRLYMDGVLQKNSGKTGSATYTVPTLFNDFFMIGGGADYVSGKNYFRGYIDDVRISRGVVAPKDFLKSPSVGKTMRADDGKLPVVAYWPFGGKYNRDATGNGFDLTMDSTIPLASGTPKVAWSERAVFTNFYLTSFPMSAFSKTGVTIECFVKSDSGSTSAGNILMLSPTVQYHNNVGAFRFSYEANFKTAGMVLRLSPATKCAQSITTEEQFGALNDNRWRHFAAVYDPSKKGAGIVTFYVDGVAAPCSSDDADQGAVAMPDTKLYFSRIAKDSGAFYGQFDDVRITAGVLTPDKFMASRSEGSTAALYRFDKETLEDQSGNGTELTYCQGSTIGSGTATYGVGADPASGKGLILTGKTVNKDWLQTANPVDFSGTKAMTVEVDYNCGSPSGTDGSSVYVYAATDNGGNGRGGFVTYRNGNSCNAQFRQNASGWLSVLGLALKSMTDVCPNGYRRMRYSINAVKTGSVVTVFNLDGTATTHTKTDTFDSLGTPHFTFGHCPTYYGHSSTDPCFFNGKLLRIAVSDVALDAADYVLDNLPLEPETKQTLAYWDFSDFDGLTADGYVGPYGKALLFKGTSEATTTNLTLATLTQVTVECFVHFGPNPASGTIFGLGSGVGSFAVTSDATAGVLAGSFIPYDHLAASNGGSTDLTAVADRNWHHVALVIDRTKSGADAVKFYVDYQRTTPAGRAWDKSAAVLDGAISVGSGFTGRVDDLRVSAGALEPNEFLQASQLTVVSPGMWISVR